MRTLYSQLLVVMRTKNKRTKRNTGKNKNTVLLFYNNACTSCRNKNKHDLRRIFARSNNDKSKATAIVAIALIMIIKAKAIGNSMI